jgi:hypothetical protein
MDISGKMHLHIVRQIETSFDRRANYRALFERYHERSLSRSASIRTWFRTRR